jgi:hypothetical protein
MKERKGYEDYWQKIDSGIIVPAGRSTFLTRLASEKYLQIKEKAKGIEELYTKTGLSLPPTGGLGRLIRDAKTLSDLWLTSPDSISSDLLFRAAFLSRIADALLPLVDVPDRARHLQLIASGPLDLHQRQRSLAKDTLWEVDLLAVLRNRGFEVCLAEPPDLVVQFEEAKIGIACKKFCSEFNVEKVLSQAVKQIKGSFECGIVALNLDDLTAARQILSAGTVESMGKFLQDLNLAFLSRHNKHLLKYLNSERILAVLVSTSVLADISSNKARLTESQQTSVWAVPGITTENMRRLEQFRDQLMH